MKNFVYSGESITFTCSEDAGLKPGQGYFLKNIFGVVSSQLRPDPASGVLTPTLKKGQSGELFVQGVFELPKDESKLENGQSAYWNGNTITAVEKGNRLVGVAAEATFERSSTVKVRLNGLPTAEKAS